VLPSLALHSLTGIMDDRAGLELQVSTWLGQGKRGRYEAATLLKQALQSFPNEPSLHALKRKLKC